MWAARSALSVYLLYRSSLLRGLCVPFRWASELSLAVAVPACSQETAELRSCCQPQRPQQQEQGHGEERREKGKNSTR